MLIGESVFFIWDLIGGFGSEWVFLVDLFFFDLGVIGCGYYCKGVSGFYFGL